MKKFFLTHLNVALGTLSLLLAGCHSQKKVSGSENSVMALYGVTIEDYRPIPEDSTASDNNIRQPSIPFPDSTNSRPRQEPQIMVKYGVMRP